MNLKEDAMIKVNNWNPFTNLWSKYLSPFIKYRKGLINNSLQLVTVFKAEDKQMTHIVTQLSLSQHCSEVIQRWIDVADHLSVLLHVVLIFSTLPDGNGALTRNPCVPGLKLALLGRVASSTDHNHFLDSEEFFHCSVARRSDGRQCWPKWISSNSRMARSTGHYEVAVILINLFTLRCLISAETSSRTILQLHKYISSRVFTVFVNNRTSTYSLECRCGHVDSSFDSTINYY